MSGFCNVWLCVCMGFVMWGCFDNCVGVLVICVLVFTVFCIVCTAFLYYFLYMYLFLFVTSVRTTATEWKINCGNLYTYIYKWKTARKLHDIKTNAIL
jgi:hypothetical protein